MMNIRLHVACSDDQENPVYEINSSDSENNHLKELYRFVLPSKNQLRTRPSLSMLASLRPYVFLYRFPPLYTMHSYIATATTTAITFVTTIASYALRQGVPAHLPKAAGVRCAAGLAGSCCE